MPPPSDGLGDFRLYTSLYIVTPLGYYHAFKSGYKYRTFPCVELASSAAETATGAVTTRLVAGHRLYQRLGSASVACSQSE